MKMRMTRQGGYPDDPPMRVPRLRIAHHPPPSIFIRDSDGMEGRHGTCNAIFNLSSSMYNLQLFIGS
jgi:hypothetical protein